MRLVMMGAGPFAAPTFKSLLESKHTIVSLVTRPARKVRSRSKQPVNPMRRLAEQHNIPILDPEDINAEESRREVAALKPELLIVCDYGQILSAESLAAATLGGVNLHGSLLPKYRGAAPVNWAIYHGEVETGVAVIHMTPKLDGGPCLALKSTPIGPDETAVELEERLSVLGVEAVMESLDLLEAWDGQSPLGLNQDKRLVSRAPKLKKTDGEIDWTRSARQLKNQVRAMRPWPGAFTTWRRRQGEPLRLLLEKVEVVEGEQTTAGGGEVVAVDKTRLWVAAGEGVLSLHKVQPAGKRALDIAAFLRGYRVEIGDKMGE